MNKKMLESKMKLFGDTNATLAQAIGISRQSLSSKKNETRGAEFTQGEIAAIKQRYTLSAGEVCNALAIASILDCGRSIVPDSTLAMEEWEVYPTFCASSPCVMPSSSRLTLIRSPIVFRKKDLSINLTSIALYYECALKSRNFEKKFEKCENVLDIQI